MDNFRTIDNWKECRIGETDYFDEENKLVQNGSPTAYCGRVKLFFMSLCKTSKENGAEYVPDMIFYLCLGKSFYI